ncbi:hypothetical protein M1M25_gp095 [Tenacibaculum phage Gundel_1]|uniref:Uncharacterized protein n=1 Tax=Tenacibaculum phage Gundel_1 TaxID=2745672 RepID=A0A8E4ZK84_9CAUD|nr:hypothetical protein M1M25_gp095 [Tenacibaculum phage Gundel_1]QQV91533.1 hypothetical protein Gundel1_95 [Tenacibaculum phage Gundel_1]
MSEGNNTSVYLKFKFRDELDEYAINNGFTYGKNKPNRSKALVSLAKKELNRINADKRIIEKYNGEKKRS